MQRKSDVMAPIIGSQRESVSLESSGEIGRNSTPSSSRSMLAVYAWLSLVTRSAITMLASFVATPYLLRYLGAERVGALRASQQWSSYLTFLYFGLGPALVVVLLRSASRNDIALLAGQVKSAIRITRRRSILVVMPMGVVLAWFMPTLVGVSPALRNELRLGALIGVAGIILTPYESFRSMLATLQLGYLVNVALSAQALVVLGLGVWLAWLGWGLPGQYVATVGGLTVFSAVTVHTAIRHLKGFFDAPIAVIDRKELSRLQWPMLLTGLGGQMNLLTDYIVVSLVLEPVAVTVFSITQRLISVLGTVISSFGDASWAGLAELRAANRHDLFEQRLLELVRTFLGAGLCLLATFAAFNSHFVKLWVGPQYYAGNAVTVLTAAQTIIVGYFMIFGLLVDMSGDTRYRVTVALPGAALNLALSIFLGRKLGLYGITLATVIAYLAGEAWFSPYLACTRYGISGRRLIRETLRSLALSAPWVAAVWWAADRPWHGHGWTSFAASFAIASGLTMAYVWFVTLRAVDRTAWVARIRQMMSSQSKLGRAE